MFEPETFRRHPDNMGQLDQIIRVEIEHEFAGSEVEEAWQETALLYNKARRPPRSFWGDRDFMVQVDQLYAQHAPFDII